jgi:hypothetical protein
MEVKKSSVLTLKNLWPRNMNTETSGAHTSGIKRNMAGESGGTPFVTWRIYVMEEGTSKLRLKMS